MVSHPSSTQNPRGVTTFLQLTLHWQQHRSTSSHILMNWAVPRMNWAHIQRKLQIKRRTETSETIIMFSSLYIHSLNLLGFTISWHWTGYKLNWMVTHYKALTQCSYLLLILTFAYLQSAPCKAPSPLSLPNVNVLSLDCGWGGPACLVLGQPYYKLLFAHLRCKIHFKHSKCQYGRLYSDLYISHFTFIRVSK